jgi:hypothetical protein
MLDGCWTYVVLEQSRGGTLCVNNGIVAGGNGVSSFDGVVVGTESAVQIIILAKKLVASSGPSAWGDSPPRYFVTFKGKREGKVLRGRFERSEFPDRSFEAVMTYEGPPP